MFFIMLNKVKLFWSKTNRWHRALLFFVIVELRLIPGGQIGFMCNDPTLSYPFRGDTINFKWLLAILVILPLILILFIERLKENSKQVALRWYKHYLFGALLNLVLVQFLKLIVGSPRPHFFDSCQPKEASTCKGTEYVSSYTCTKAGYITQSAKSFPSGHTSLAVHYAVFTVYYLHQRTKYQSKYVSGVQWASAAGAMLCAVTRITDRRHHWWDVVAGALVAVPVLIYTIFFLCRNFKCRAHLMEKCEEKTKDNSEGCTL